MCYVDEKRKHTFFGVLDSTINNIIAIFVLRFRFSAFLCMLVFYVALSLFLQLLLFLGLGT
jgi:hypothetical protein